MPSRKYESEGGPTLKKCSEIISLYCSQPILDKQRLLQWVIFNVLIGNADGHAKNISLLYRNGSIALSPFYDLLCTSVYDNLNKKLAMKIGGENRIDWIRPRHWERLAADMNVTKGYVLGLVGKISNEIIGVSKSVKEEFQIQGIRSEIINSISNLIEKNAKSFLLYK